MGGKLSKPSPSRLGWLKVGMVGEVRHTRGKALRMIS